MNYEQILPYIEKKLVSEQSHPEDPDVRIFNYTQVCQYEKAWDDVTRNCRGLIMNVKTGEILARPFPKFFNYQEHLANGWPIPDGEPIISEKLDGSLGILYELGGKPWIATRGSFMSEQAVWATKWWRENVNEIPRGGFTELYEIVYPENRIVVNYDFSGLVFLAARTTEDGIDLQDTSIYPISNKIRRAKRYPSTSLEELKKLDEPNSEGFVLLYPDGTRMKIKFPEYIRLHKLVTGLSEIAIWEHLKGGGDIEDLIQDVPDEFYDWVKRVAADLYVKFGTILKEAIDTFALASTYKTRKEKAEIITKSKYPGISFAILDGKGYTEMIYKLIRPRGKSQFKTDIDS